MILNLFRGRYASVALLCFLRWRPQYGQGVPDLFLPGGQVPQLTRQCLDLGFGLLNGLVIR
jgi:hypothetical protein